MENLKNIGERLEEIKKRGEKNKEFQYRFYWLRVSFALVKDEHIKQMGGANALAVFMTIRTFANKDDIAYPSLKTIANKSCLSVTTVQKAIKQLIKNGWLSKLKQSRNEEGKLECTRYQILEKDLVRGSNDVGFIERPVVKNTNGD